MSEGRFNLSALAVRERSLTLFLILLISLAGLISFFKLVHDFAWDPPASELPRGGRNGSRLRSFRHEWHPIGVQRRSR